MAVQGRFGQVLGRQGVRPLLGAYLLSRLAATTVLLALLLAAQASTGSFASAGALTACLAAGTAVAAPLLGRAVDRRGQRRILSICAVLAPLALVAVVLLLRRGEFAGACVAAAAAGAILPPVTSCMRSIWPDVVQDDELMDTAWTIESLVVEITELAGPLLAGGMLALVSPAAGVLVAAALTYTGPMLFALSRSAAGPRAVLATVNRRGPLSSAPVRSMLAIIGITTAALAATEVAVTHAAVSHHHRATTGVLLALWLSGSLLGGWVYGRRTWSAAPELLQPLLLLVGAVLGLLMVIAPFGFALGAALFVAGLAIAPATAVQFALMSRIAAEETRTETFTWASTAGFVGLGLGSWFAGVSLSWLGGTAAWWTACGFGLLASAIAATTAHRYRTVDAPVIPTQAQPQPLPNPVEVAV